MNLLLAYPQLQMIRDLARRRKVKVFLVGGFLRDNLLGRPSCDFDFALERGAVRFARALAREVRGAFVLLDEEHGCGRVVKKQTGRTWTYDFADFRGRDLKEDLRHRDFTVNTLAWEVTGPSAQTDWTEHLIDVCRARGDLKAGRLRMVGARAFQEDPLRLLRAFSLRAMTGFSIERGTLARIRAQNDLIRQVSPERVREELFKVLECPQGAQHLKAMDRLGLLEKIIPQITIMYNVHQGTYHHLDVWPHSLETVVQLEGLIRHQAADRDLSDYLAQPMAGTRSRGALIKLAALLHDVGKPESRKREPDRISFHGHERVGRSIVKGVADLLKLSTKERHALQDMVLWHLRPGYLSNFKSPTAKAIYRFLRDTKDEAVSVALLSWADQRATRGPLTTEEDQRHHEKICQGLIKTYFDRKKEKPFVRLINGDDLIRVLRLAPSPLFARILGGVEEQQVLGKVRTREEALALARQIASAAKTHR